MERNPRGGGGLALYWKNSIDVHVDSFSKYHIDSIINKVGDEAWRFTGFYGELATPDMTFLGIVLGTLMKSQEARKNWEAIIEVKLKCNFSGML